VTPPLAFSLFDGQPEWSEVALALGVAFLVASLVAAALGRLVRLLLTAAYGDDGHVPRLVASPVFVTRLVTFLIVFPVTALPMLDAIGERFDVGFDQKSALRWLFASGLRIAIVATIAWLIIRIVASATGRFEQELARGGLPGAADRLKRARTLGALVRNVAVTLVGGVALLMVLRELNVDVMPMLTGAGIAGVALGFGAQWLVRDLIAGFFLILEDHVRVGDSVVINGQGGGVEAVNLRTIILRDAEGAVHVFPNGAITTLANRTRDYAYYMIDVNVDFRQDTDKVVEILRRTAADLQADPGLGPAILEPLEVLGVDAFRDGQVTIKSRLKTLPQRQWEVGRELRRRLRYALAAAGIDLPAAGLQTLLARTPPAP
jgi:small conductance mechanosensitive channel